MGRLIRLDRTGHTELAEWTGADDEAFAYAAQLFAREVESGMYASVEGGSAAGEVVRELPADAELVVMRRPIVGG